MSFAVKSYGAVSATEKLCPLIIQRRNILPDDVKIDVMYCGVCHSDLHTARSEWGPASYPCVPGHEIIGVVSEVGSAVTKFKVGDRIGVGCMVDSCLKCESCVEDKDEQYCHSGATFTYNSPEKVIGGATFGGYTTVMVVKEHFCVHVPMNLDPAAAAPLLCAGVTTWSPLKYFQAGPGKRVAVIGLGGLGHMALKFSKALGAETVLLTTSAGKVEEAKKLGADRVVISKDNEAMAKEVRSFDLIIDTVSASHNIDQLLSLLKKDGTMVLVGLPEHPMSVGAFSVVGGRKRLTGSAIGSIKETEEMLQFCADHNITADVELIDIEDINEAWERMVRSDVKFRFVIDTKSFEKVQY